MGDQVAAAERSLPALVEEGGALAGAVNGVGTIVGGVSDDAAGIGVPVRWIFEGGGWHVEQLDLRPGSARGVQRRR